jgi:glycerophosphoryl diester phosphodiesterase
MGSQQRVLPTVGRNSRGNSREDTTQRSQFGAVAQLVERFPCKEEVAGSIPVGSTRNPWRARRPLLIAHRGGALEAPENTLFAFRHAVACGAAMVELDLRATSDGEIVVLHDRTLDRTTDGSGAVAERALAAVQALDAAHWFVPGRGACMDDGPYPLRGMAVGAAPTPDGVTAVELRVPTLEDVLRALPDTWLTMELKAPGLESRVAELLGRYGRAPDVIIGGFATERLEAFRDAAPHVATSATEPEAAALWAAAHGHGPPPDRLPYAALQVPPVHDGHVVVTAAFVAAAHERGRAVHVWTVDEPVAMHRLLDLGVDGIMTDRPTVLAEVLAARG